MLILPAIDIKEGRVVRLVEGEADAVSVYGESPSDVAARWEAEGARWLHVVDLDGAFAGEPRQLDEIARIAGAVSIPIEVGGGLRTLDAVARALDAGASRVILGTATVADPQSVARAVALHGERIAVAIDVRDGRVAIHGWSSRIDRTPLALGRALRNAGVRRAIVTDIRRDGRLDGLNVDLAAEVARGTGLRVIASGGVSRLDDLRAAERSHGGIEGVIVGKALYERRFSIREAIASVGRKKED